MLAKPATVLCLLTERDLSTHVKTFDLVLVLLMEKWEEPQQTWGERWEEGKDGINHSDPNEDRPPLACGSLLLGSTESGIQA